MIEIENKRAELGDEEKDGPDRRYIVEWRIGMFSKEPFVFIQDIYSGPYSNGAYLSCTEALKLLEWLKQERAQLETISKQEGNTHEQSRT